MNSTLPLFRRTSFAAVALPFAGAAFVIVALGGCGRRVVVQSPPPTVIQQAPAPAPAPAAAPATVTSRETIVVKEAPPPPRTEMVTSQPSPQHVWVAGYWAHRGGRQIWVPGRWELPPQPDMTWVAPRWEQRGDEWVFIEGGWRPSGAVTE